MKVRKEIKNNTLFISLFDTYDIESALQIREIIESDYLNYSSDIILDFSQVNIDNFSNEWFELRNKIKNKKNSEMYFVGLTDNEIKSLNAVAKIFGYESVVSCKTVKEAVDIIFSKNL
jgi:hypothetical protein